MENTRLLHSSAIVAQFFTFLAQMLWMDFRLIGDIQAVWFLQRTLNIKKKTINMSEIQPFPQSNSYTCLCGKTLM